jgi:predicted dienelactone hydrolase
MLMTQMIRFKSGVLFACLLVSCGSASRPPTAATTVIPPTATLPQATATIEKTAEEAVGVEVTQEPAPFPLSEPGPYHAGKRTYAFEDASRDNRPVSITVWYPALRPEGSSGTPFQVGANRDPDPSGAPYPLILSSTKAAGILAPYLISHGFTWASVDKLDTWDLYSEQLIDQPLDLLFALDQVATDPPGGLEGMIDAERSGAIGYSFDGYNALALSGARIDPEFYQAQCASPDATAEAILSLFSSRYQCALAGEWDEFASHAGEAITNSDDGLWQPMTDPRIRAVVPLAAEGWLLFGDEGLASVDRPVLIIDGTLDVWYTENALIFDHLGTPDKTFISFVDLGHMMVYEAEIVARMAHFAVAFFGYHLQGRDDLARYFSEEFVSQHDDLAWGVYEGQ